VSIPGRIVNILTILGGMLSSATLIGLVHEHLNLSDEENHVFSFIKSRKKDKTRKNIAANMVKTLFKMRVF